MKRFKTLPACIVLMMFILSIFLITGCSSDDETGHRLSDDSGSIATPVTFTFPANGATGVQANTKISTTFSEAMDPLTITNQTFTIKQGATSIPGAVTYAGVTAVFIPAGNLSASTTYTATMTTGVRDLAGKALVTNYVWSFTTGAGTDITTPTLTFIVPAYGTTGVAVNSAMTATFSEPMDPLSITNQTFTLKQGATVIPCVVTYSGVTALFKPVSNLAVGTAYTATITNGVMDLAGNPLIRNYVWNFTTGTSTDSTAPMLTLFVPAHAATGVDTDRKISATFSEAMNPLTITNKTFTLKQGTTAIPGIVTYSGLSAVFTPASNLAASTNYTATMTTGAEDLAGNALAVKKVWSFTTGVAPDTTAPTVTLTVPAATATGVALSRKVQATFSEPMDPFMFTNMTFTLTDGVEPVEGTVSYVGLVATFTPTSNLAANTTYHATMTTGVEDMSCNPLASNYEWSFTTVAALPPGPLPVDLGTAENFAILAKSGITTTGATTITGNIGVSPVAHTAMTGFGEAMDASHQFSTSPLVNGRLYAADYAFPTPAIMTAAVNDMETAYVDAAARPAGVGPNLNLGGGTIAGQTLAPGTYTWDSHVTITTNLTLNGGPDDVWIFQITGTLNMSPNMNVVLTGGAQAKNVFWQVASDVTLRTGSHFEGILLAKTKIAMNAGASIDGRLSTQTAVSLNANTVTQP